MERNSYYGAAAILALMFCFQVAHSQFTIRIPKLPKVEKPKDPPDTTSNPERPKSDAAKSGDQASDPTAGKTGNQIYGDIRRDFTPRLVKDSVYVQAETAKEYWKAPGQKGFHSWVPKLEFDLFYNHERKLQFVAEYYNPDGTLWFSEPLEIGNASADNTNPVRSDRTNTNKMLSTKSSIATGLFGFKIREITTPAGETFYQGKFKIGKFLPPYSTKNEFDFYVDHDWLMPIGIVSFHHSNFHNFGDNIGGFELFVNMWFKGNYQHNEHGLEARLFYKGRQIATTAGGEGFVNQESEGAGERATEKSIFAADLHHWRKWSFRWKQVRVDNGGTFNRDTYPNAHYVDKNPGDYVVKVYKHGTQVREANFSIGADGRVVDGGYHKPGYLTYHKVIIPVKVIGASEKWNPTAWRTESFYGNTMTGFTVP